MYVDGNFHLILTFLNLCYCNWKGITLLAVQFLASQEGNYVLLYIADLQYVPLRFTLAACLLWPGS